MFEEDINLNLIRIALGEYGRTEISGPNANPEVMKYYDEIGHSWVDDDSVSWCAAFANWVAKEGGCEMTGKLDARSFLKIGEEVTKPMLGDVVVFWRGTPDSWKGHVGFYIRDNETAIWVLGGNQGIGQVNITPYTKTRLLGYRRLKLK